MSTRSHRLLDYLPGRWSSAPPSREGVYFARSTHEREHSQARYWEPKRWDPSMGVKTGNSMEWEFYYLVHDVEGSPSRADDTRVHNLAQRNGWTPLPTRPKLG